MITPEYLHPAGPLYNHEESQGEDGDERNDSRGDIAKPSTSVAEAAEYLVLVICDDLVDI